jgi:TPR repeat protein
MPLIAKSLVIAMIGIVAMLAGACARADDAELFQKLTTIAEQGSAKAQYHLGLFYKNGIGTKKNPRRAFEWFQTAAASGDPLASYKVGCYYAGQLPGPVRVDEDKALSAKLIAAMAGFGLAQSDVGFMYALRQNFAEAIKWWSAAAAQGDVRSLVNLSDFYRMGLGVPKDEVQALTFMLMAVRIIPDDKRAQWKTVVDPLRKAVSPESVLQAERAAAEWTPKATELTVRYTLGRAEAEQLVQ